MSSEATNAGSLQSTTKWFSKSREAGHQQLSSISFLYTYNVLRLVD
jgi:hypothetical protein